MLYWHLLPDLWILGLLPASPVIVVDIPKIITKAGAFVDGSAFKLDLVHAEIPWIRAIARGIAA